MKEKVMRYKKIRYLKEVLNNIIHGWFFKMNYYQEISTNAFDDWYILSSYTTKVKNRIELGEINQNRIDNMKLCIDLIDGIVLEPKSVFSLFKVLGETSSKDGFKKGPVIINKKVVYATGGGVCQVSSTIFNAVLLGNLKILQKHNHSQDTWGEDRFIDLGRDAAYVYLLKDLKFQNIYKHSIVIKMKLKENNLLECTILTKKKYTFSVEIKKQILKKIEPDNKEDKTAINGWVVKTLRYINHGSNKNLLTYKKTDIYKPGYKEKDS